jgi:transposase
MRTVALDLGSRKTAFCEVAEGRILKRGTVSTVESLRSLLGPEMPPSRVALEACREAWHVHDVLSSWGNEVVLVDTTRSRRLGIGQHGRKTDRIDAEVLARALERGGIPVAHVLSPHRRELRRWLNVRRALVESRAQLVTTARGLAREHGTTLPRCATERFALNVATEDLDAGLLALLSPLLTLLSSITAELKTVEGKLTDLCSTEPVVELLATTPGVGPIVAASFVSVVDDANRFRSAHHVESYLGLVPSEDSSGGKRKIGSISKKGNPYLRSLLVQSAWSIMRSPVASPLRLWADAVAERRGKKVAVVALARRLVGILWAIWRDGSVYDANLVARTSSRGTHRNAQSLELRAEALRRSGAKLHKQRGISTEVTAT